MNLHFSTSALFALLLTCPRPQTDPTGPKALPDGVLAGLVGAQELYCEDQFGNKHAKGCEKKFASHLKWSEIVIAPAGETAFLVENRNQGFCGSAGCALLLFVPQKQGSFVQILGADGEVGTLSSVKVLKTISKGHYDIQKTWHNLKTQTLYTWDGTRYTSEPQKIARALFPNAPAKAQTVSCFRALKPEISMYAVVQKCGRPDEELGSGIYIFVWHLADGSTVSVGTPYLETIGDIRYTDSSGKTSSLLGNKQKYP